MIMNQKNLTIRDAQEVVKNFAMTNGWVDEPNIDKFDHLHEELIEMSQYLRYKTLAERKKTTKEKKKIFVDGVGDLLFGLCRLANQLGVDMEEAFLMVEKEIKKKYARQKVENNIVKKTNKKFIV